MVGIGVLERDGLVSSILISVNGCVAGSIFGIPWGYAQSGWFFSTFLSIIGFFLMMGLGFIVLQVLSRMPKIHSYAQKGFIISHVPITHLFSPNPPEFYIKHCDDTDENTALLPPSELNNTNVKYDFTMICKTLLGKRMEKVINTLLVFNSLVFLMGCTSTFASSLAAMVPIGPLETCNIFEDSSFLDSCRYKYMFYILIFSMVVGSMTLIWHFSENKAYLITVCIVRILVVLVMGVTSVIASVTKTELDTNDSLNIDLPVVRLSGFGISVPIIYLTMGLHVLIPDLLQPLKHKHKNAVKMLWYSFFISFCMIVLIGTSTIFACEDIQRLSTLNWQNYSNGENSDNRPWWTYIISLTINIFPAFDVTSIFSITAVNTVDNILALKYSGLKEFVVHVDWIFWTRVVILAITLIVPVFLYDLGIIFALAGAINMLFILLFVVMFGIASVALVPELCPYDNFLTRPEVLRTLLVLHLMFVATMWGSFISHFF